MTTKRAEAAESQLAALRAAVEPIARREHERAVGANALFSVEHWKHNAGPEHPHEPDDDSYIAFENCKHPLCASVRSADPRQVEPVRMQAETEQSTLRQQLADMRKAFEESSTDEERHLRAQFAEAQQEAADWRQSFEAANHHVGLLQADVDRLDAQLDVLKPGGTLAWKSNYEVLKANTDRVVADLRAQLAAATQALDVLWQWASEGRTHLDSDPVPDGLGQQVLAALQGVPDPAGEP